MSSAADIITYIGIPLAVLGVLPTLYTCFKCLVTLCSIRNALQRHGVTNAETRSSLLSGVIEIEIPRKRLTPLDRDDPAYFALSDHASSLRGGSWTLFRWKEMTIGIKSYRVQFRDELRQPQAEIDFERLVTFLLDRGAVPDDAGFRQLRSAGLWTPAGTKLLSSPRSTEAVLMVTTADDSDGILSLAVYWEKEWERLGRRTLPPYWIRIRGPPTKTASNFSSSDEKLGVAEKEVNALAGTGLDEKRRAHMSLLPDLKPALHARVTTAGLQEAYYESDTPPKSGCGTVAQDVPQISHLLPSSNPSASSPLSLFFATALTALHSLSPHPSLWSFAPEPSFVTLAMKPTIPIGVLDLLSLRPNGSWRSQDLSEDIKTEIHNHEQHQAFMHRVDTMRAEGQIKDPAERQRAIGDRMMKETREMMAQQKRRELEEVKRREEEGEACRSERLGIDVVAYAGWKWLGSEEDNSVDGFKDLIEHDKEDNEGKRTELVPREALVEIAQRILYMISVEEKVAEGIGKMVEDWKVWSEVGGDDKTAFACFEAAITVVCICIVDFMLDQKVGGHVFRECGRGFTRMYKDMEKGALRMNLDCL
ncbi:MAG: hypothetical protein M1820_001701 [Bogoriella megaspora]|nr:MAG: hypothetical protein M1820_001701 [Bogoriella megaspora]